SDATVAQQQLANLSVGLAQLINGAVDKTKVTTTVGQRPGLAQLEILTQSVAFSTGGGAGITTITPTTPIPTATYELLAVYVADPVGSPYPIIHRQTSAGNYRGTMYTFGGVISGNVIFVYIAR